MDENEFNQLVNGPLYHPLAPFAIMRLALALAAVVDATGDAGAKALREHCSMRESLDRARAGAEAH